jgi:serine/threonine-protein kinase HipA
MTSEPDYGTPGHPVYVWAWLPGAVDPVVAGAIARTGAIAAGAPVIVFTYARSYLQRPDAISLFTPELPLGAGTLDPTRPGMRPRNSRDEPWKGYPPPARRSPLPLAGCLRDAAPDAWGRRVVNLRLAATTDLDLDEITYLLASTSDRTGALDFTTSPTRYRPRGEPASLEQLLEAADLVEHGEPIPDDLVAAADHGTSIGGARPKALIAEGSRSLVAKFSSSTDDRPAVKAEAVGMLLAAEAGIDVAPVEVIDVTGRDVLLVDRFDRPRDGSRRMVVSALTILGLRETEARYAGYADLARAMRHPGWSETGAQLRELYTRMVLNIAISNTDDHLRNHAAFWDGTRLRLTPAYDVAPQRRSTGVATHAIPLTDRGENISQFRVARAAAPQFLLSTSEADDLIDHVVTTIRTSWNDVCDRAQLTRAERQSLWGREILNDYAFYEQA